MSDGINEMHQHPKVLQGHPKSLVHAYAYLDPLHPFIIIIVKRPALSYFQSVSMRISHS